MSNEDEKYLTGDILQDGVYDQSYQDAVNAAIAQDLATKQRQHFKAGLQAAEAEQDDAMQGMYLISADASAGVELAVPNTPQAQAFIERLQQEAVKQCLKDYYDLVDNMPTNLADHDSVTLFWLAKRNRLQASVKKFLEQEQVQYPPAPQVDPKLIGKDY